MKAVFNRQSHLRRWLFYCSLTLSLSLWGCSEQTGAVKLSGSTMGTTWHVSFLDKGVDPLDIQQGIEQELEQVNASMSTYRADSEISRFNALNSHQSFAISSGFQTVLTAALKVGLASGGAYDVTVGPIVNLWGFGPEPGANKLPDPEQLKRLLSHVGQDKLQLDSKAKTLAKKDDLALDFSSIAKGYGVDRVALWLGNQGLRNFLVEIGGEVRVAGKNSRGGLWRIAVEQPDAPVGELAVAVVLTDTGIATSGDYRNYFELAGKRFSHTIDPRTGNPVSHDLVSVTVVHTQTMMADAWATALMVLGAEEGMRVALAENLAVYFIRRTEHNYSASHSPLFAVYLESPREH